MRCPDIINDKIKRKLQTNIAARVETLCKEYKKVIDEKHELLDRAMKVAQEVQIAYEPVAHVIASAPELLADLEFDLHLVDASVVLGDTLLHLVLLFQHHGIMQDFRENLEERDVAEVLLDVRTVRNFLIDITVLFWDT